MSRFMKSFYEDFSNEEYNSLLERNLLSVVRQNGWDHPELISSISKIQICSKENLFSTFPELETSYLEFEMEKEKKSQRWAPFYAAQKAVEDLVRDIEMAHREQQEEDFYRSLEEETPCSISAPVAPAPTC